MRRTLRFVRRESRGDANSGERPTNARRNPKLVRQVDMRQSELFRLMPSISGVDRCNQSILITL